MKKITIKVILEKNAASKNIKVQEDKRFSVNVNFQGAPIGYAKVYYEGLDLVAELELPAEQYKKLRYLKACSALKFDSEEAMKARKGSELFCIGLALENVDKSIKSIDKGKRLKQG